MQGVVTTEHPFGSGKTGSVLSLGGRVEDRFDVEDRGAVDRFEVSDQESQAVDGHDLDPVEADRGWVGWVSGC